MEKTSRPKSFVKVREIIRRGPKKIFVDYRRKHLFKFFRKKYPELKDLKYRTYADAANACNKELSRLILEEAFEFIIPNVGNIRIKKYKPKIRVDENGKLITKHLPVDWKATKELWAKDEQCKKEKRLIFITNDHSDGYRYYWYYNNTRARLVNKGAYSFMATRTNDRELGRLIKDENFTGDYYM